MPQTPLRIDQIDRGALRIAGQAYKEILGLNRNLAPALNVPGGYLYHYTSAEGLKGIIESKCIHASAAYLLNDSSEISYGCEIMNEAISALKNAHMGEMTQLAATLLSGLTGIFSFQSNRPAWTHSVFVACFCEEDNLLSQWRAYGQPGGYSLGVPISSFNTIRVQPEPKTYTAVLTKVQYERGAQVESCQSLLKTIVSKISCQGLDSAILHTSPILGYDKFQSAIEDLLIEEIVGFKNPAFKEEREWRLVARRRELVKQSEDDDGKTPTQYYFRTSRGLIVPFIRLVPVDEGFPISTIRFGPTLDRRKGEAGLRAMLAENDFHDIKIEGSDIPILL